MRLVAEAALVLDGREKVTVPRLTAEGLNGVGSPASSRRRQRPRQPSTAPRRTTSGHANRPMLVGMMEATWLGLSRYGGRRRLVAPRTDQPFVLRRAIPDALRARNAAAVCAAIADDVRSGPALLDGRRTRDGTE